MSQAKSPKAAEPEDNESSDYAILDLFLELLLPATMMAHLLISPYTKVEESFNMQAIHDVANLGMPVPFHNTAEVLAGYDHVEFPGVVPRSFAAAGFIGGVSAVILGFVKDGLLQQIIVRALIGIFNCCIMILFSRRASRVYGKGAARWYLVLQAGQFHIMYYASRTLPNMLAFGLAIYALAELLPPPAELEARADWFDTSPIGLQVLIITAVIFRAELALLFLTSVIPLVAGGWISIFPELLILGGVTGVVGVLTAVSVDTFFWQTFPKPMWAELEGFLFNTIQGRSSEYGVSPIYYYFVNVIPKLLLNPLAVVLIPIGVVAGGWQRTVQRIVGPALGFVAIYSLLPHKEWRFIIYIIPGLTLVAGIGADYIFTRRRSSILYAAANLALVATVAFTFIEAFGMSYVSSLNYPGGAALLALEDVVGEREYVTVHMDVETCMTGATRFTQNTLKHPGWTFSKEENREVLATPTFWSTVDYAITANPGKLLNSYPGWEVKKAVKGYTGVMIPRQGVDEVQEDDLYLGGRWLADRLMELSKGKWVLLKVRERLWILGRKGVDMPGFEDVKLSNDDGSAKLHDEL
ncbi:dolichyl-P-Man:Man(7)GlcNAc(2)-PP-dolichol alpha-1,6-mannosyltransferase [Orbilia brochopaga]|uniref:Mannosyltransferase n=1 Tax=Orbilia brochopaga TaxID=3140254 RepID=A0AAV9UXV1_9PEZI